jgi:hypothetical protein
MKTDRDNPRDTLTPALEAISNLLFPGLDHIFSRGWREALMAHSDIEFLPVLQKAGTFYRNFLPLLKSIVLLLVDSYRRYFKLALAHPRQVGRDPNDWAWVQLQPAVGAALDCIRDWYISSAPSPCATSGTASPQIARSGGHKGLSSLRTRTLGYRVPLGPVDPPKLTLKAFGSTPRPAANSLGERVPPPAQDLSAHAMRR